MTDLKSIQELDGWLQERNLGGHWNGMHDRADFRPFIWKWSEIYEGLMAATELVPMDQTGRRTIQLKNPSLGGDRMSNTIHMSVQCVMPGEVAEAHKHTAAAVRFVVQGSEDAATVVNGEPLPMVTGDFITTPSNCWHDHYNHSDHPVIWLDGLDVRLASIGKMLGRPYDQNTQEIVRPIGYSEKTLGHAKPSWVKGETQPPAFRYRWDETNETMQALKASEESDPYNGILLTYSNPMTGGPTLPTFACEIQTLTPRLKTKAHKHISTTIYYCHQGKGVTTVDGERLEWEKGDIFVVPPWLGHFHENLTSDDAILYSMNDYPTLQALGLYQEEEVPV